MDIKCIKAKIHFQKKIQDYFPNDGQLATNNLGDVFGSFFSPTSMRLMESSTNLKLGNYGKITLYRTL